MDFYHRFNSVLSGLLHALNKGSQELIDLFSKQLESFANLKGILTHPAHNSALSLVEDTSTMGAGALPNFSKRTVSRLPSSETQTSSSGSYEHTYLYISRSTFA